MTHPPCAPRRIALAISVAFVVTPALAVENWHGEASLRVGETWTDNVNLAPDARSDWITEITPGVRFYGKGARTDADVWASWQNYLHADSEQDNNSSLLLNARGRIEAIEKRVWVEAKAGMTQQNTSMFGAQNTRGYNSDNNRSNVRTFSVSPYGTWHLGRDIDVQARYRYEYSDSDSEALSTQTTQSYDASIANSTAWGKTGWGASINGEYSSDTNDATQDVSNNSYRVWLSHMLSNTATAQVFAGQERNNYQGADSVTTTNYGMGLDWAISPTMSFSGDVSHRFFGTGYHLRLSKRWRMSSLEAGASREVNNWSSSSTVNGYNFSPDFLALDSALRSSIPDATERSAEVLRQLAARGITPYDLMQLSYLSSQYSLERREYISGVLSGVRNKITLTVSHTNRRRLDESGVVSGGGDLAFFESTDETSYNATWSSRVTPVSTLFASINYSRARGEGGTGDVDTASRRTTSTALTLDRKLSPQTDVLLSYRYTRQTGTGAYTENVVAATLFHRF